MTSSTSLIHPLTLGPLVLPSNVIYAPLAGCSDLPFRQIARRYHQGLIYAEMVKMEPLVRGDPHTLRLLDYTQQMHPIGAQLCGSRCDLAAQSAKRIEDLGFDIVDYNCGCPVDKVTKDGSGSAMLKHPERIGQIIAEMVAAVNIPVSVKIRSGWDEHQITAPYITQLAQEAGASMIVVHGRTREQRYRGKADWDVIRACKEVAHRIKVIGNGDIFHPEDGLNMLQESGCDGILVARGTLGQPFIGPQIEQLSAGSAPLKIDGSMMKEIFLDHFHSICRYRPEKNALFDIRRVGCWYLRKGVGTRELREQLNRTSDLIAVEKLIHNYNWDQPCFL